MGGTFVTTTGTQLNLDGETEDSVGDILDEVSNAGKDDVDKLMDELDRRLAAAKDEGDPFQNNPLLTEQEGFCPLTLVLHNEDNSDEAFSFTQGNRNYLTTTFNEIIKFRTKAYKMKRLLEMPIEAFEKFPETLEEKIGAESMDTMRELAEIPGIDGHEIVRFANSMQVANARKTLRMESASSIFRYLPNKNLVSIEEYQTARMFLVRWMEINYPHRKDFTRVNSIGIPTGLIKSGKTNAKPVTIYQEASYLQFPEYEFQQKKILFHPNIFIIPGSLPDISLGDNDPTLSIDQVVKDTKFLIASRQYDKFATYEETKEWFSSTGWSATNKHYDACLTNHVLDYCIQAVLKITSGLDLNEDTFRLNKIPNKRFISTDGIGFLESLTQVDPSVLAELTPDEIALPDLKKIFDNISNLSASEINSQLALLDCRLFTPETIARKCLTPRIFDRTFCVLAHPQDHHIKGGLKSGQNQHNLYEASSQNGGTQTPSNTPAKYKIILNDSQASDMSSEKMISHMASYSYRIEQED